MEHRHVHLAPARSDWRRRRGRTRLAILKSAERKVDLGPGHRAHFPRPAERAEVRQCRDEVCSRLETEGAIYAPIVGHDLSGTAHDKPGGARLDGHTDWFHQHFHAGRRPTQGIADDAADGCAARHVQGDIREHLAGGER